MSIRDKVELLKEDFKGFDSWEDRYKRVIEMGAELPPLSEELKIEENLVKGCISKVWLATEYKGGKIVFKADSDAAITKGIVAMLVSVYSGETPDEIIANKPDFLDDIGIKEALSMNRANGLNSMIKQINFYALAYKAKQGMK